MMPHMAKDIRSSGRSAGILFRMSASDRERLREEARANGFDTVQQLLEFKVFGEVKTVSRRSKTDYHQEELLSMSA